MASSAGVRATLVGVALAVALSASAPRASAEPTAAEKETARALLLSGREKRKAGQLKGALADFEKAHSIMHVPTTGLDLGRAQESLGMLVEARATLLEAARHPAQASDPAAFLRARREAAQLAEQIAPRLATLTVATTNGARVKIDGGEISPSSVGLPLKVNPGKHEVIASLGHDEKHAAIELAEGESASTELFFPPPRAAAPAATPTDARASTTRTNPLVWVGLAVAGAGTIVGTTTGLLAFGVHSDVTSRCEAGVRCPPSTYADIDRGATLGTVSTISFVVAGVGAIVLVYGLMSPASAPTGSASVETRLRACSAGVCGSF